MFVRGARREIHDRCVVGVLPDVGLAIDRSGELGGDGGQAGGVGRGQAGVGGVDDPLALGLEVPLVLGGRGELLVPVDVGERVAGGEERLLQLRDRDLLLREHLLARGHEAFHQAATLHELGASGVQRLANVLGVIGLARAGRLVRDAGGNEVAVGQREADDDGVLQVERHGVASLLVRRGIFPHLHYLAGSIAHFKDFVKSPYKKSAKISGFFDFFSLAGGLNVGVGENLKRSRLFYTQEYPQPVERNDVLPVNWRQKLLKLPEGAKAKEFSRHRLARGRTGPFECPTDLTPCLKKRDPPNLHFTDNKHKIGFQSIKTQHNTLFNFCQGHLLFLPLGNPRGRWPLGRWGILKNSS